MILEQFEFKCDNCDHVSVFDNRPILRRSGHGDYQAWTTFAWCLVCKQVVPSESIPLREYLAVFREDVLANAAAEEPIADFTTIEEIEALIDWRAKRESYPRCLNCFSESILQQVPHPRAGGLPLLLHPACGGRFSLGLRYQDVDQLPQPLIIDEEGHPVPSTGGG